ncbi:MAG: ABC transporter permease [Eubacterium sp.]|jgi:ribose/xylose/arabinose/galactoside ABC-type transport system permease subunit|nr:ABC transporter permease [Eubacterium sp.]
MMKKKINFSRFSKPIILVAFIIILTILRPTTFPTVSNIANVLWSVSVIGIMACGAIFVFLLGGIDLSIATLCGLSAVVCVTVIRAMNYSGGSVVLGILLAMAIGCGAGLLHGFLITTFQIPAFLVTFATSMVFQGLSMLITNNKIIGCTAPESFTAIGSVKLLGFPLPIYLMILIAVIGWYILRKTVFGRQVYAVGGNQTAAEISGIRVRKVSVVCYMLCSLTVAVGGIILASMTQQAAAATGSGYTNDVITAAVIGGVSLLGGEGTVPGAIFGAVLMGLLNNGMNLMSVPSTQTGLVKGLVIIVAVAFDAAQHADQSRKKVKRRAAAKN